VPTLEQAQNELNRLYEALDRLSEITPESLVRQELGNELSFEQGRPAFTGTLKIFRDLQECNFDGVPYATLNRLADSAEQALSEFNSILDFSLEKFPQSPMETRDQFIKTVQNKYAAYFDALHPIISYSVRKGTDFEALEEQARQALQELNDLKDELIVSQNEAQQESKEILDSMKQAAGKVGVAQHAIFFEEESTIHEEHAGKWLGATIAAGTITLIITLINLFAYFQPGLEFSIQKSIQLGIAKILIFSVLSFAIFWTSKNYRAHRHNSVINRHRHNALKTFETFVKAADDEATKNAVLLKATETIFSPGITGYITREPEHHGGPKFMEIVRAISKQDT